MGLLLVSDSSSASLDRIQGNGIHAVTIEARSVRPEMTIEAAQAIVASAAPRDGRRTRRRAIVCTTDLSEVSRCDSDTALSIGRRSHGAARERVPTVGHRNHAAAIGSELPQAKPRA